MHILKKTSVFAVCALMSASALAGKASAAGGVPELDGGYALLALGLVAAIVAFVKERRRT